MIGGRGVERVRATSSRCGEVGDRGSASVEFALVLPLLLVLVLAVLQVGIYVTNQLVVEGAARSGARQAAVSLDDATVTDAVTGAAAGLDPAALEVTIARGDGAGSPVTVTVVYRAAAIVPAVGWLFPSTVELTATATMREETG